MHLYKSITYTESEYMQKFDKMIRDVKEIDKIFKPIWLPTKYQVEKRNGLDLWIEIQINCFYHGFLILVVYNNLQIMRLFKLKGLELRSLYLHAKNIAKPTQ